MKNGLRSPYYEQRSIDKRREQKRSVAKEIYLVEKLEFVDRVPKVDDEPQGTLQCDFCCEGVAEVGLVFCSHKLGHMICQACLTRLGGAVRDGKSDVIRGDDCPCQRKVAERLMGKE